MDNRGMSIGIVRFFLSLIVGAMVVWILRTVANPILEHAGSATSNQEANEATVWFQTGVDYMPIVFLGIAFFGIIALAVYQREVLG